MPAVRRRGRDHPRRHRHPPGQHRRPSSRGCSAPISRALPRRQPRRARRQRRWPSPAATASDVPVWLNRALARRRRAHHHRLRRAAFLRRLQRRAEDGRARAGRAGDDAGAARRPRIGHPNATWGITEGNPVHDDVREIARMTGVALRPRRRAQPRQAITQRLRRRALRRARGRVRARPADGDAPVAAPFDIVVTTNSGYPLDQNLYQAVKGMSAAACIVKPGGTIICAAECRDGFPTMGVRRAAAPAAVAGGAARDGRGAGVRRAGRSGRCRCRR